MNRIARRAARGALGFTLLMASLAPAAAGPPYMTDDPEPTDTGHFEIYAFTQGMAAQGGTSGQSGIDFNYGGAPNLQLTATAHMDYAVPPGGPAVGGLGNVELAAKYRFLTQQNFGLDVAVFPRVFLPSASANVGDQHASLLLPVRLEKDWGKWSAFGGGGCELNRGGELEEFLRGGNSSHEPDPDRLAARRGIIPSDRRYDRGAGHDVDRRRRAL